MKYTRPGPWDNEPDRLEFESHGLPCVIQRTKTVGTLCGYVGIPVGNLFGDDYDNVKVDVHGGLTYSGYGPGEGRSTWWFGFDCAHYGDLMPKFDITDEYGTYRDIEYVKAECIKLAAQLSVQTKDVV